MHHVGDRATDLRSEVIRWNNRHEANRHEAIVEVLGTHHFKAAVGVDYEVDYLLPGLNARPADISVHPPCFTFDPMLPFPVAFDVTLSSPIQFSLLHTAPRRPQAAK
eukprot:GFKZ01011706.1.p1 GENE.GFKZ01011706.1~~GFKZ01011706.1.p1  ORF type:complete len:122 (+),score=8.28 GFKZ01011706.1:46-366(+)